MRTMLIPAALALALAGCANLTPTEQRVGGGAALGSLAGLAIGSFSGNSGWGALIGAGVGAAGGYLYDQHVRSEQQAYRQGYQAGRTSAQ